MLSLYPAESWSKQRPSGEGNEERSSHGNRGLAGSFTGKTGQCLAAGHGREEAAEKGQMMLAWAIDWNPLSDKRVRIRWDSLVGWVGITCRYCHKNSDIANKPSVMLFLILKVSMSAAEGCGSARVAETEPSCREALRLLGEAELKVLQKTRGQIDRGGNLCWSHQDGQHFSVAFKSPVTLIWRTLSSTQICDFCWSMHYVSSLQWQNFSALLAEASCWVYHPAVLAYARSVNRRGKQGDI